MTGILLASLSWAAAALYAVATGWLVVMGLNSLSLAFAALWRRRTRDSTRPPPAAWPDVVVQLPVYNEPAELVARAVDAALALAYPGRVEVQLLDDSSERGRADNATICGTRHGVQHLFRDQRDGFKAGALANGMQATAAEVAVIFDVDFQPRADTLLQLVPALLADPEIGFVQARWVHPAADESFLGRAQAMLLDLHFAVEQAGRDALGWPITFNGTAGAWRRAAIEDAGGWEGDTLAEDLDLALRARLAGWRGLLLPDVTVPADLPATVAAWRIQQSRWTKGLAEVGRKLLPTVWRSGLPLAERASITLQVGMAGSLPALLTIVLLHPLLTTAAVLSIGPGASYFAWLSVGWLALLGAVGAHAVAQRWCYPETWRSRLALIPVGLAAPFAILLACSSSAVAGVANRKSPFVRTPKGDRSAAQPRRSRGDIALAAYSVAGAAALFVAGAWAALVFQALFAVVLVAVAMPTVHARSRDRRIAVAAEFAS